MKFGKTYKGGTLRSLLFRYSVDRSKVDPLFKEEFDAAQAEERRIRAARAAERKAAEQREAA